LIVGYAEHLSAPLLYGFIDFSVTFFGFVDGFPPHSYGMEVSLNPANGQNRKNIRSPRTPFLIKVLEMPLG
jgi:hypothetical protein